VIVLALAVARAAPPYDPLRLPAGETTTLELEVAGERELPLLIYLPFDRSPAPVVLFSHGLGGSRYGSSFLGKHWSGRGYVVVYLQHPGSDDSVWKEQQRGRRLAAMKSAASAENLRLRIADVPRVLDQLTAWSQEPGHPLSGRLDLSRIGMSGHSFGALTTQAVGGQSFPLLGARGTDSRIRAALPMSPSAPRAGDVQKAFGQVTIPWMLMTGTEDTSGIVNLTVEERLAVYPALPPGGKYELVLNRAKHSAFTNRPLPGDGGGRNPNHHRSILALSTAFWDAYLKEDPAAREWLDGAGPRDVLDPEDRWQHK
jgi:predicted dienelactone hydrolase